MRNSAGFLKNSTASKSPRLDFENSPAQSSASGCESEPCDSIALKSSPPVSCSMLIDFGSPGSKVPMPTRAASEKRDALDREAQEVAAELVVEPPAATGHSAPLTGTPVCSRACARSAVGDQVQRLLVHRAALERVDRAVVGARPGLEAALEQPGDRARRPAGPKQQDAPAGLVALGRGLEVAHDTFERHVEAEQLAERSCRRLSPACRPSQPAA